MPAGSRFKYYVGVKNGVRKLFAAFSVPTEQSHPEYTLVIGPFVTKRGAQFMLDHGHNNPHVQNVADAERLAKSTIKTRPRNQQCSFPKIN